MAFQFQLRATGGVAVAAVSAAGLTTRGKRNGLGIGKREDYRQMKVRIKKTGMERKGKEDELRVHHFLGNVKYGRGRGSNSLVS